MSIACLATRTALPSWAGDRMPVPLDRHAATCLRCQAEAAAYRSMVRDLAHLGEVIVPAPATLAASIEAALPAEHVRHRSPRSRPWSGPLTSPRWPSSVALAGLSVAVAGVLAVLLKGRSQPLG